MRNIDERKKLIDRFGEQTALKLIETDSRYKNLREAVIPDQYKWLFNQFLFIHQNTEHDFVGNPIITFRTILDFEECMGVELSYSEKKILFKMKHWVSEAIQSLK